MVVIAHLSYTFEQNDEARLEIQLVKIKLGNISEAHNSTKIHNTAHNCTPVTCNYYALKRLERNGELAVYFKFLQPGSPIWGEKGKAFLGPPVKGRPMNASNNNIHPNISNDNKLEF